MTESPKCLSDLLLQDIDEEYIDWLIENFEDDDLHYEDRR